MILIIKWPKMKRIELQLKKNKKAYFAGDFHLGKPDNKLSLEREKKIIGSSLEASTELTVSKKIKNYLKKKQKVKKFLYLKEEKC